MKYLSRIKQFIFFLLHCLVFFLVIFFINNFFSVKNIQLVSDRNFSLTNKNKLINKSLLLLNKNKIAKEIINENFLLKKAIINKVWPNTLKISVYFYDPGALLVVDNGFFVLSTDGRILQKNKDTLRSLPVINYYQKLNSSSFQTGDWIEYKDIKKTLFFVNKLQQIHITPLTIDIKGQDVLLFNLLDDKKIIFSNSKDKGIQNHQLELIIKQFKIEGKEFKKIDLRFDKPIIQF